MQQLFLQLLVGILLKCHQLYSTVIVQVISLNLSLSCYGENTSAGRRLDQDSPLDKEYDMWMPQYIHTMTDITSYRVRPLNMACQA
ncbi:hypothetical protein J3F84DRAFT_364063 [Trichoderma pleuroticola]